MTGRARDSRAAQAAVNGAGYFCAFCGSPPEQVFHLIVAPGGSRICICDRCVDDAAAIIAQKRAEPETTRQQEPKP